jgi:NifU-like protein involved in Fe-S cluster formation
MDEIYSEMILENARYPKNKRKGQGLATSYVNEVCGDTLTLYLDLGVDGVFADVSFECQCCALSTASASMFSEWLKGKNIQETKDLSPKDIYDTLGISMSPNRSECTLLVYRAFIKYLTEHNKTKTC